MKQDWHIAKEILLDALIGGGGLSVMFSSIEAGIKIVVGIGTAVLLYYRIEKAIHERKQRKNKNSRG